MKIVTWNIAGIPDWANMFGNPTSRVQNILHELKSIDPDIICLQEVFSSRVRWSLWANLLPHYHIRMSRQPKVLCNGGLLIASKWPIIDFNYYVFKNCCGEDFLAEKGFMHLIVKKNNEKISIINTHLNADSILSTKDRSKKKRQSQLFDILSFISQIEIFDYNILCGDLNDDFRSNLINTVRNAIKKYKFNYINDKKQSTFGNSQLDYIIFWGNKTYNIQLSKKDEPILSDHSMMIATCV